MKRLYYIIITAGISAIMFSTGCINEKLEPCPEGNITINLLTEKFGKENSGPVNEFEPVFGKRIGSFRYSLYNEGNLLWEKQAADLSGVSTPSYTMNLGNLGMGNYTLVVSANVPASHYEKSAIASSYAIKYPGADRTQDYFSAEIPMTVDCNCDLTFSGTLRRLQTVVRSTMYEIPSNIASAEVTIDNLSERLVLYDGHYDGTTEAVTWSVFNDSNRERTVIVTGSFPTAENGKNSAYRLKLYDKNGNNVYDKIVTTSLRLKRNTLTDVIIRFPKNSNGDIIYEINMNTTWNGHNNGGSTELE